MCLLTREKSWRPTAHCGFPVLWVLKWPLSQKAKRGVVGAKVALSNLLCCLSSGNYPPEWGLEAFCEYLCGKWMVPVTSTHRKHIKKWKPVDVIISSATEQSTPSHTSLATGFVSTLLSPAFKQLAVSPWPLDLGPCSYTAETITLGCLLMNYPCKFPY